MPVHVAPRPLTFSALRLILPALLAWVASGILSPASGQTPAQQYFSGTVVDALTGYPLAGAEISVAIPSTGAVETVRTDLRGRFAISESLYFASIGMPLATVPSPEAGGAAAGTDPSFLADGRSLAAPAASLLAEYRPGPGKTASLPLPASTLAKRGQAQGGPPFIFRHADHVCRSGRMRMLALRSSIQNPDPEPDHDLVIPLVPLLQTGGCGAP